MAYWIFDPGHGGNDPGAIGQNGLHEADINLQMALKVREILVANGETVDLIRTSDTTVGLSARPSFANSHGCDYFVSFHNNSSDNRSVSGTEVHVQGLGGKAETLGKSILNELVQVISPNRGLKVSNLCVNRESNMPSCLIEGDFISNPNVEGQMRTQEWINKTSIAIAKGCLKMVGKSYGGSQPTPQPVQQTITVKHPIMGVSDLNAQQMVQFLLQNNPTPSINCTALELAQIFLEEGSKEGVRGDIAFAQAIKETGYFKFGGDVIFSQNNYCGLGTTGGGVKGAYFESPRIGIRAMIQHLKAYASNEPLQQTCVDPRYNLVTKGITPNWEDLNGKWAVPGYNYGQEIYKLYDSIKAIKGDLTTISQPTQVQNIFTYPNNAQVVGDDLYIRNENGEKIEGRYVSDGDYITVLDVSYSKGLILCEYPTSQGIRSGYVKNMPSLIKYYYQGQYHNGSTPEKTYQESLLSNDIGELSPYENATPLYRKDGHLHVVYNVGSEENAKSGYCKYDGEFTKF